MVFMVVVMLVLTFLVGRLVYLMIFCSEYYGKKQRICMREKETSKRHAGRS